MQPNFLKKCYATTILRFTVHVPGMTVNMCVTVCVCVCNQETEKLESEQMKLQDDIKTFQREKDELEFILEAHRLHCGIGQSSDTPAPSGAVATKATDVKVEPTEGKIFVVVAGSLPSPAHSTSGHARSTAGSAHLVTGSAPTAASTTAEEKGGGARRPNSLVAPRLIGGAVSGSQAGTGSQVAGVSITTPSAGINVYTLGLESMLDGHTGLTPITGFPVSLTGLSTPIFAIPATVAGVMPAEETAPVTTSGTALTSA